MRILPIIILLVCVAWEASARPQDDEPRAAPNRGLLKRGLVGKSKTTTTTPPPPAEEEGDYEEEGGDYQGPAESQEPSTEAPVSSTEGKKLVSGGVRPFRSNTDFLEALKRRRAQAAEAKQQGNSGQQPSESQPEAPAKSSYSKKRFHTASSDSNNEEAPAPSKPSRGRFSKPSSRSHQPAEPENEEHNDAPPPARSGRTFSRRGGQ